MLPSPALIERPHDLTDRWLTEAIGAGPVTAFDVERIGTGQMSECYRVSLTYRGDPGPASVVLKVAAADPSSRQTGLAMGLYEREVRFYTDIAPGLSGPVAPCLHAAYDPATGAFDLLLADAAPAVPGDEIRGATTEQAHLALQQLGVVHRPLLGDAGLADAAWLNRDAPLDQALLSALYAGFLDRYSDQLAAEHRRVCDRFVASFDAYTAAEADTRRPRGLVHGDFRLDNMLFGGPEADRPLTVVDWQTVTWGPAFTDVAYFLGCALPVEQRRAQADDLLGVYHAALGPHTGVTLDDVRDGVRRQTFFGVMMAIVSPMLVERTARGDEMFMTMIRRHCQHVLDLDALAVLPAPAAAQEPLQPEPADEGAHDPGDEESWSESWYFDVADPAQGVGAWLRLGLLPNQRHAWINALVCGPGRPTVAVVDFAAALPADHTRVLGDGVELTLRPGEPLRSYTVRLQGRGEAYDDPAALLDGGRGRAVDVELELTWTTAGTPYQYRLSPRYEIPCTVSGTVTVGDETVRFDAAPGQRDHSWAARDWWSMDWVWSALHLDDGTHLHGLDLRIPGMPPLAAGYVQTPGAPLVELDAVTARETFDERHLPVSTEIVCSPGDLTATVDVRGHAPVLLTAADGRVSRFPRAWGEVRTSDGRRGVGWIEWNRNQV